jgi:uncharacterized protein (DUF1684 family)
VENNWLQTASDFRTMRESNLRREYGWLSLAGLFWLEEGDNAVGSGSSNPIRLPERTPAHAGIFTLHNGNVTLTPAQDVAIRIRDAEVKGTSGPLNVDTSGEGDFIFIDTVRMLVIERAGNLAIRVWDPESALRRDFAGCVWYEPDVKYRVTAKIETYPEPRQFMIDDIIGIQRPTTMHAALVFTLDGKEYRLDGERQEDNSFDIIFKDLTANKATYGAGRYLTTDAVDGDQVIVDFNVAYNPPCAFTEFATCPLPLPQNILPVAIEAGEQIRISTNL